MHYSYYKRPLLWLVIIYVAVLALFYTPSPGPKDAFHFISSEEITLTGKAVGFASVKKKSTNIILKVAQINGQKAAGRVYARFPADQAPAWHETVTVHGKLKKPYSVNLLGNFDWASYLASKNIFAEIKVTQSEQTAPPGIWARLITRVRADILGTFEKHFERNLAAIAGGVLLGERGEIDEQLYADFQDSGAMHLLVASGGNVGFVTLLVFAVCGLFGLGRRKTAWLALTIAGIYTLIAGADAPLTRAYFMTACAVAGYILHRNSGVFQGLILSCLIILILNPAAVFETGFTMSFLATLAIVVCLNNYQLPYRWPRWVKFFVQIFLATLSTQLVLLPVFTNVFYKVSFVGLAANMVLVPLASFLMAVSFLFCIFSWLHLGFLLHAITWISLFYFKSLVEFFASLPFAAVPAAAWRAGWIAAYYAGLFLLFNLPQRVFVRRIYKAVLAMMILALCVQYVFFNPPTVWLLNEWNKNAILLRTSSGQRLLIGAGIDGKKLARAILRSGGRSVDGVLLSEDIYKQLKNVETLQEQIRVGKVVRAFEDIWPDEDIKTDNFQVRALWGILLNKQNETWINRGYSGRQDSLSYAISYKKLKFTTAGNNRFIMYKDEIIQNTQNATRAVKL